MPVADGVGSDDGIAVSTSEELAVGSNDGETVSTTR